MHKKSKLLKSLLRRRTYLSAIAVFVLFTEHLFAGHIYDGMDNTTVPPRRLIQVVFGTTVHSVTAHPDPARIHTGFTRRTNIGTFMRNYVPPITGRTHVQFWRTPNTPRHNSGSVWAELGIQANAYQYSYLHPAVPPPLITFSNHNK